jgi:penicillin-binding protein 1A
MGAITLRTALEKSRNLVSADIISRIGIDPVIQYARKLGIRSPLGRNLSLSLGSSEVNPLEFTRAYGVFAAKGVLFDSQFIHRVLDRDGNVLYDGENENLAHAKQVIKEESAFIIANMMKGVVENGTGYKVKALKRPVAGKTGTSNDQMDAWFIGYTPTWVCGVWAGFDAKREIGKKETGGAVSAPIFLDFMSKFLGYQDTVEYLRLVEEAKNEADRLGIEYAPPEPLPPIDFAVPEGVDPYWIDKETGALFEASATGAVLEYFVKGTEPERTVRGEEGAESYLNSPDL